MSKQYQYTASSNSLKELATMEKKSREYFYGRPYSTGMDSYDTDSYNKHLKEYESHLTSLKEYPVSGTGFIEGKIYGEDEIKLASWMPETEDDLNEAIGEQQRELSQSYPAKLYASLKALPEPTENESTEAWPWEPLPRVKNKREFQLCPKCEGQGMVVKPPYLPAEITEWSSTACNYVCGVCNGAKIIARPESALIEDAPKEAVDWNKIKQIGRELTIKNRGRQSDTDIITNFVDELKSKYSLTEIK